MLAVAQFVGRPAHPIPAITNNRSGPDLVAREERPPPLDQPLHGAVQAEHPQLLELRSRPDLPALAAALSREQGGTVRGAVEQGALRVQML